MGIMEEQTEPICGEGRIIKIYKSKLILVEENIRGVKGQREFGLKGIERDVEMMLFLVV